MVSEIINSNGLLLDISGVCLLFKFGLSAELKRDGTSDAAYWGFVDPTKQAAEKAKAKRYENFGRFALGLLVFGFTLQIISNWVCF